MTGDYWCCDCVVRWRSDSKGSSSQDSRCRRHFD